ncbi:MAG TPA: hypothetical protein VGG91_23995 [Myxococcaceae bacterium]
MLLLRRWRASAVLLGLLAWGAAPAARAYPWMIKHDYAACAVCHADPSGGGLLTAYGRAQSEILMRMPYGASPEEEPKYAGFLYGLVDLPDWLLATVSFRGAGFTTWAKAPDGSTMTDTRYLQMLLDARGMAKIGAFRVGGALGWGNSILTLPAAVFTNDDQTQMLLAREYWVGLSLAKDSVLLRFGRVNLPFGLRNVEHTSWVRDLTQTDINISQQTGLAVSFESGPWRTEVLAMVGNLRASDTGYRERGFSGYGELKVAPRATVGLSALVSRGDSFVEGSGPYLRQAYGAFARWAPVVPVTLMFEADAFTKNTLGSGSQPFSGVGWLQVDVEPTQGLHVTPSLEILRTPDTSGVATGYWLTLDWFFLPHSDIRMDVIYRNYPGQGGRLQSLSGLIQLHTYL